MGHNSFFVSLLRMTLVENIWNHLAYTIMLAKGHSKRTLGPRRGDVLQRESALPECIGGEE